MSLETRSFLLGIATVSGLVIVGFGGGILMGGVLSGDNKTPNKIERQAAARDEKPVQPVVAPVEAKPVPAIEAKPAVTASPAETPLAPAAAPPASSPQPVLRAEAPPLNSEPALGPQKPVALTQQPDQVRSLSRREEVRIRKEQRRAERDRRREERRKLIAERRERDLLRREEMRSERLKRPDFDDDDDERPVVREYHPRAPDLPFFRIFN